MFKKLNIEVQDIETGVIETGRTYTVENLEHSKIIDSYARLKSMLKVAKEVLRSPRTVQLQLHFHNDAVAQMGECQSCSRAKSKYSKEIIVIRKRRS